MQNTAPTAATHIANRRLTKASALASIILRAGGTADKARHMTDEDWDRTRLIACVNPPSADTKALVVSLLEQREAAPVVSEAAAFRGFRRSA